MTKQWDQIGFIGGGNMAEALIKGLLAEGVSPDRIWVADPSAERQTLMRDVYRVQVTDNRTVVDKCRQLVLAIKPQMVEPVVSELAGNYSDDHLLISILAGTSTATLEGLLGGRACVVRVMPNTPALVGAGAAVLCAGQYAKSQDLLAAEQLFRAVGIVRTVTEEQMDAVTGLSGSGPAYVFSIIEALTEGGVDQGLPREVALDLATQTVLGAARLVAESGEDPAVLRAKVCSPGGTTLAGMTALEDLDLKGALVEAVTRATKRSKELGQAK